MSDNIPFDIQMDIMNRLHVKSLLQFRAVSKQWKFSIDNFEFIRNYGVRESTSCFNLSYKHDNRQVDFHTSTCQFSKWQLLGLPCGHVIAITKYLGLTDCLQFVSDWFKKPKYQGTYAEPIHFIGNVQEWEFPQHIRKAVPPGMDNPQSSRPKNAKRIKSQGEEPRLIHCTRCKQSGHRRDNCKKPFIFDPPINIRTQHEQQIPRYEQPSFHQPHQ
ncbi:transposase, MuDR, MULE transposase domain protein [Tanacetum coccineum]